MIDYLSDFSDAINNIQHWKKIYSKETYIHRKLLVNLMFRAYCTNVVFEALINGELVMQDDEEDSIAYIEDYYLSVCQAIGPRFIEMIRNDQQMEIATVNHRLYQCMAYEADDDPNKLAEMEFCYIFEHVSDVLVLYYVSLMLCGNTREQALNKLIGIPILAPFGNNLFDLKEFLQENFVMSFMSKYYQPS